MKWLVTGVYGFIGSNFAQMLIREGQQVVGLDAHTYAANPKNIEGLGIHVIRGRVEDRELMEEVFYLEKGVDIVVNFAAESHVDRSIDSASEFVRSNFEGVSVLLDMQKAGHFKRLVQVSTDEVYGSVEQQGGAAFHEGMSLIPNSPYSATKASADLLVGSYVHTHKVDAIITRCSNNYGPYQNPEKMLPKCILNSLAGKKIPVYGDGKNVRDWIHVEDHCRGIYLAATKGEAGEVYNFGGNTPIKNIDLVMEVLKKTGASDDLIEYVTDRKGHDRTYRVSFQKSMAELGWKPEKTFEKGLDETIKWYAENESWWKE